MGSEKGIEMKCWTREEYLKFSEYMVDDPVGYYYFQMLYWCGLREGEALALTIDDFDFKKDGFYYQNLSAFERKRCNYRAENTEKQPHRGNAGIPGGRDPVLYQEAV